MQLIERATVVLLGELKNISARIALTAGILGKLLGFFALMMVWLLLSIPHCFYLVSLGAVTAMKQ
ncbi:MAG: hypothetical protein Rpha_0814 [Candidatus Ruthia sp. Apha_13_S6]|nr:hypothetical protein [Candidatus Ruthia sp. Apha_13_S6]